MNLRDINSDYAKLSDIETSGPNETQKKKLSTISQGKIKALVKCTTH